MNFQLTHPLPRECLVAVSGGLDSVAVLHWLSRVEGRVRGVVHFNHNSGSYASECAPKVAGRANRLGLPCFTQKLEGEPEKGRSLEDWWREQRYRWFKEASAAHDYLPVVVAHNLDDCLEEYIICTMLRGFSGTIPYAHGPCIRPFRLWKREDIHQYALREQLNWEEDPSNQFVNKYRRAFVRHKIAPRIKRLNPGIYKIVERVIREQDGRTLIDP